ncbi:Na(+)/H(+) antiporter subunit A [bacterium HR29]|nr:Na(+)/H(+) antiporter subunit A [bacterium HR29]
MELFALVGAPFLVAAAAPLIWRLRGPLRAAAFVAVPAAAFAWLWVAPSGDERAELPWVTELGLRLVFELDGLSRLFALLITGVGAVIAAYTPSYFGKKREGGWFAAAVFAFMGSMLGAVCAANVLTLFVFWELTSLASYALIGFRHTDASARESALQALFVTTAGGLAMLAGLVLWGQAAGGYDLADLLSFDLRSHHRYPAVLALVLAGAATKSAQVPFHFWLPNAMAAPTPASAYLHSATMVKLGVYLLARFAPALGGTEAWTAAVGTLGGMTLVTGAVLALTTRDAKRLLAYTTVGALGAMLLLVGLDTPGAAKAAAAFILAHALYKAPLFLAVGAIEHGTGTRDLGELRGLAGRMPATCAVAALGAAGMAGVPPTIGFLAKEAALEAADGPFPEALAFAALGVGGAGFAAAAALVGLLPWLGRASARARSAHEAPFGMWAGPLLMAAAGAAAGLLHPETSLRLVSPAASAIAGETLQAKFAFWHGWNAPVMATAASLVAGAALAVRWDALRPALAAATAKPGRLRPEAWYAAALAAVRRGATVTVRALQHGKLRWYIATSLAAGLALALLPMLRSDAAGLSIPKAEWRVYELAVCALIVVGALGAAATRDRIFAIVCLGAVGLGTTLVYVIFSAPDLALTQLLVDTLAVIVFVLAYYHFPRALPQPPRRTILRDAAFAAAVGGFVTLLLLGASAQPARERISAVFAERSLTEAFGRNVVNVILVDFRALDTLGEIAVLAAAGVGVYGLLKLRRAREEE